MDPEVVKKALEQFPNFAVAVKDAIVEYKQVAENIIRSGDKDNDKLIEMIDAEYQQLIKMLDNEELTFEEKLIILERLDDLQNKVSKENKEMRNYRLEVAGGVFAIIVIGILSLAAILFVKSEISKHDDDIDDNDIDLDDISSDID